MVKNKKQKNQKKKKQQNSYISPCPQKVGNGSQKLLIIMSILKIKYIIQNMYLKKQ